MTGNSGAAKDPELSRWEIEKAKWEAEKIRQEVERANSPSALLAEEAKNLQAMAEAEKKSAEARNSQIASLVPNLTDVDKSVLQVGENGPAIGASSLTFGGLKTAAEKIATLIDIVSGSTYRILVTSDQDLATPDSQFLEVSNGFNELVRAAESVIEKTADLSMEEFVDDEAEETSDQKRSVEAARAETKSVAGFLASPVFGALGAVASALPAVISLLSAKRSVTSGAVTVADLAAAAAVAGEVERRWKNQVEVVHDEFRLIPSGRIQASSENLAMRRIELVARKLRISEIKSHIDSRLTTAKQDLDALNKEIAETDPPTREQAADRKKLLNLINRLTQHYTKAIEYLAQVDSILGMVDAFNQAIHKVQDGARRSPIATAALYEQLHPNTESRRAEDSAGSAPADGQPTTPRPFTFTHVLLVKTQPGQWTQLTSDRPLMLRDKFATLVETNVTFMLISTTNSTVVKSDTVSVTKAVRGELGSTIHFETVTSTASNRPETGLFRR